jgi:hypothetical protein
MNPHGINLYPHQEIAINNLKTGSILNGGVGSGKSLTALIYYLRNEHPKNLYIITTAKKRDSKDWENEIENLFFTIDSWNNIKKYINVVNSFFIFDEQRVVGSGSWVKSFLKIVKENNWILLTATPGDTWMDYIPVFIANNFYKNRSEFIRRHVVYNNFSKFPKIDHYVEENRLIRLKDYITVNMEYSKKVVSFYKDIVVDYNKEKFRLVFKERWNPYKNLPIKDISELFFIMRRVVNEDETRFNAIRYLTLKHNKLIVFYNFNYELEILRQLKYFYNIAEYNGHKHEEIPKTSEWIYLVQYLSGAEGWNCIDTNTIVFYSQNYSYKIMQQAAGRIDRINTPFPKLYYYNFISDSIIDKAIRSALIRKKIFNERAFFKDNEKEKFF